MLSQIKRTLKRFPILGPTCAGVWHRYRGRRLAGRSAEDVFTEIWSGNGWNGSASVSGTGSDLEQTARVAAALPGLLREHGVGSLLDVPCGDFHWMQRVDLAGVRYVGGDVVRELVEANRRYEAENISFLHLDLLAGPLPRADLVLCRDCLVHFSFADVCRALRTIAASECRLLLTTTYPHLERQEDIRTGQWRPLNLQRAPFGLPAPLAVLEEGCTEAGGQFGDKSLGLWRIDDLRACLAGGPP
jgi:hypothetical protein